MKSKFNNPNSHIYFDGLAVPLLAHYFTSDINEAQVRVTGIIPYTPEIDFAALTIADLAEVDITFKGHDGTFYSVAQLNKGLPK